MTDDKAQSPAGREIVERGSYRGALAILDAIQEPSEAMVKAGWDIWNERCDSEGWHESLPELLWRAMIDALKREISK